MEGLEDRCKPSIINKKSVESKKKKRLPSSNSVTRRNKKTKQGVDGPPFRWQDSCSEWKVDLSQWFSNWLHFRITCELKKVNNAKSHPRIAKVAPQMVNPRKTIIKKFTNLAGTNLTKQSFIIIKNEKNWHQVPCNAMRILAFLPKMFILNLIMRKCQTKSSWGTVYKTTGLYSFNCQCHERLWKAEELFQMMYDPELDPGSEKNFAKRTLLRQLVKSEHVL